MINGQVSLSLTIFEKDPGFRYSPPMSKKTTRKAVPREGSYSGDYLLRLDGIENRAKAIGHNWTTLCAAAGISRAGPVRWRKNVPLTIRLIDTIEETLSKFEKKQVKTTKQ